jgi:hypothetical protein
MTELGYSIGDVQKLTNDGVLHAKPPSNDEMIPQEPVP